MFFYFDLVFSCYMLLNNSVLFIFFLFILEGDLDNFLIYFKRVIVLFVMGRLKFVLFDLDRVFELRFDFF